MFKGPNQSENKKSHFCIIVRNILEDKKDNFGAFLFQKQND